MILVDSSVWIDYFNGVSNDASDFLDNALGQRNLIIGDLILAEVLQGFRHEKDFNQARSLLTSLDVHNLVSEDLAVKCAHNYRTLRTKGLTIRKTIDSIIATYCLENDIALLHSDRDFLPFAKHLGLKVFPVNKALCKVR